MRNKTDYGEVLVSGLSFGGSVEDQPTKQTSYISEPVKGDGLVHRASGLHTIQIHTINTTADIMFEATLDRDPCSTAWIPISITNTSTGNISTVLHYVYNSSVPNIPSSGKTIELNEFFTAQGQYAWIRVNISNISNGIIDGIKVSF
jgi:hypothetical protein